MKDKTFAYLSVEGEPFSIACKLARSSSAALELPFTKPTEYGLGKSGWVSATFSAGETPPVDLLKAWIDESYRAQAPKKLVATLPKVAGDEEGAGNATKAKRRVAKTGAAPRSRRAEGILRTIGL